MYFPEIHLFETCVILIYITFLSHTTPLPLTRQWSFKGKEHMKMSPIGEIAPLS